MKTFGKEGREGGREEREGGREGVRKKRQKKQREHKSTVIDMQTVDTHRQNKMLKLSYTLKSSVTCYDSYMFF